MSKKDYIAIARAIFDARALGAKGYDAVNVNAACDQIAADLAGKFADGNPRFDRARFLEACGAK